MSGKANVQEIVDVSGKITINDVFDQYGNLREVISKICAKIPKLVPFMRLTRDDSNAYYHLTITPKMLLNSDNYITSNYCLRTSVWFTDPKPRAYIRFSDTTSTIAKITIEVAKKDEKKINRLVKYISNQLRLDVDIQIKPFLD